MRILTVRQPWAWAIIHGGKDVENRTRNIAGAYRGPIAIHAGLAVDWGAESWAADAGLSIDPDDTQSEPRGAVIGVVDLVDVHHWANCMNPVDVSDESTWTHCSPWAMDDHHHLVLANPRALTTPIPAKGRLGLWTPDPHLEHAITTALATTSGDPS